MRDASMWLTFIIERAPRSNAMYSGVSVFIMQLLGAKGIGGKAHVRPDLVEQRADGDTRFSCARPPGHDGESSPDG